ncbi:hypothetical protein E6W36_05495 [Hankyongella ginsenosidimutans]|uniref:Uncharacterized protein n=2 Tax=Hankyongella ginsenosidimutans TaxID=1763828 RepID=A0A4D7C8X8_9SPHN|nr:hypothetical protein E6W36_05495 [Hankyongella ginsenosidimutans]TXG84696.1 MAG: hypothetical protein E6R12_03355 [Sphingomonadales bacterium]
MRALSIAAALCAALLATGYLIWRDSFAWPRIDLPLHGMIALGIGVVLTFLLGAGLMALVFYSARRGYDDLADKSSDSQNGDHNA